MQSMTFTRLKCNIPFHSETETKKAVVLEKVMITQVGQVQAVSTNKMEVEATLAKISIAEGAGKQRLLIL